MNYTKNYHLPQWKETDRVMMNDFNQMCLDIESGIESAKTEATTSSQALSERITAAQRTADTAQTTAGNAQTAATKAQTTADTAKTAATKAQTTADTAQTAATKAQATADKAQTAATKAQTTADKAQTAAGNAQTTADSAQTAATKAQTTADSAQTAATKAQTAATKAQTAADKAQTTADDAMVKASSAYNPDQKPYVVGTYVGTGSCVRVRTGFKPSFIIISGQTIDETRQDVLLATGDVNNAIIGFHIDYFAVYPAEEFYPQVDLRDRTYHYIAFR